MATASLLEATFFPRDPPRSRPPPLRWTPLLHRPLSHSPPTTRPIRASTPVSGDTSPLQSLAKSALDALRKPAAAAVLLAVLLSTDPHIALAASGGRVGGRSFSSSSSSRPSTSRTYSGSGFSYSAPYYAPSPFSGGFYAGPALGFGVGAGSGFFVLMAGCAAVILLSGFLSDRADDGGVLAAAQRTTVLKLQVRVCYKFNLNGVFFLKLESIWDAFCPKSETLGFSSRTPMGATSCLSTPFLLKEPPRSVASTARWRTQLLSSPIRATKLIGIYSAKSRLVMRAIVPSRLSAFLPEDDEKEWIRKLLAMALGNSSVAVMLLGFLPPEAIAASGGRMGGGNFSSSSSRSSSSSSSPSSSSSYSSRISSSSSPSLSSSPSFSYTSYTCEVGTPSKTIVPSSNGIENSAFLFLFLVLAACWPILLFRKSADHNSACDAGRVHVTKVQVGLLGMARSLQKELDQIAETADTSTPEGLHYILTETALALLRHPDCCISAYSSVDVKRSLEDGEKRFNELSIEERGKFDEVVNVNSIKRKKASSLTSKGFNNEYIVITILVAIEGKQNLPVINSSTDLKEALQRLGSIPINKTLAVEVLWTPQNENDTLTERELLEDYPLLRPL